MITTFTAKSGRVFILVGVERDNIIRLTLTSGQPTFANHNHFSAPALIPDNTEIIIFFGEGSEELKNEMSTEGLDISRIWDRRDETREL